jgi:hypothetical protein
MEFQSRLYFAIYPLQSFAEKGNVFLTIGKMKEQKFIHSYIHLSLISFFSLFHY